MGGPAYLCPVGSSGRVLHLCSGHRWTGQLLRTALEVAMGLDDALRDFDWRERGGDNDM